MLTIVGPGRIGRALARLAADQDVDTRLLGRGEAIDDGAGPIVVCTRADDVAAVLAMCPRPDDLVIVQNGALYPWLQERGLGHATQGQLWFAVPGIDATPQAGAESVLVGRHAPSLAYLLSRAGLPARVLPGFDAYPNEVTAKLLWLSVFGVLGDLHRETVLASVARRDDVGALVTELLPVCAAGLGATLTAEVTVARLSAYSVAVGSWRAGIKEWRWRNGWLQATARAHSLAIPLHDAACARLGAPG
ncbi:MAG: hypothetical protein EXR71_01035 [Myxococcales bacterium]|nr:hypothetical protein [Myxococcales bacterium]